MNTTNTNDTSADIEYVQSSVRAFAGEEPDQDLSGLGHLFLAEFSQAELDRRPTEQRWLKDLRQYKGQYDPDEEAAIGPLRSHSYVRKTRVKVKTVDSRVADLLFPAGNDKNWNIDPTPVPSIGKEQRKSIIDQMMQAAQQQLQAQAQAQQQQQQQPGQMPAPMMQPGQIPPPPKEAVDAAILEIVTKAAKGMSKVIDDQLVDARYKKCALSVLHSGHLYGTGVLKGPLVERRIRSRFVQQGNNWVAIPESYLVPFVDSVPLWRWYPDMGSTILDQCRFTYERHTFTRSQLFGLTKNKSFDKEKIVLHLEANKDGLLTMREYDAELKLMGERQSKQGDIAGQYEVLERWGWVDAATLAGLGVKIDAGREEESFFSNVWVLPNGVVIKAVLQPLNGITWPYHLYYFDKDETSIFGDGLASIMRDDQKMLNAATRMMLDNAAITSGPMVEVDITQMSTGVAPTAIEPWKVIPTNGKGNGKPAFAPVVIPNNLEWLQEMARQFDTNADEVTAIPRYMTGENATNGAAGTSSGLSMLMGAVNIVIKDLISGYDEGITTPFLQSLYAWNMQFNKDATIKGDFDVYARGTASLVAKEVRARQLNEFAQLTANPMDAPFIKRHRLNQLRAEALEMSDVIKSEEEAKAEMEGEEAQQQKALQQAMQQAQLAEAQGRAAKLMGDTEIAKARVQEMLKNLELMALEMEKTRAETERTIAETISKKVEAVFAALQAGGVATERPQIAPAGDEILKSVGWVDKTPDPSMAMLNSLDVVAGAELAPVDPGAPPQESTPVMQPALEMPQPQTGMVGRRAGIETADIEGTQP